MNVVVVLMMHAWIVYVVHTLLLLLLLRLLLLLSSRFHLLRKEDPIVAEPDAAVVPAEPAAPLPNFGGNEYWRLPSGFIVYNKAAESLDAHCNCANRHCKKNHAD